MNSAISGGGIPPSGGTVTGPLLEANGTTAAPSYSFSNFPTFGLYAASGTLGEAMGTGQILLTGTTAAPTALTGTIAAGAGVDAGTHSYKVTYVTAGGETDAGAVSNTVTTAAGNLQVNITALPVSTNPYVTSRKIYRTAAGNAVTGPWLLQSTVANNTATTATDNTADSSLGAAIPTSNTAIDTRRTFANDGTEIVTNTITAAGSGKLASAFPIAVGTGTATATIGGTYAKFVSGAGVGNGADTTNDALWTLTSVPANAFTANGDALKFTLFGMLGATNNNKMLGLTVGGTQVNTNTIALNNVAYAAHGLVQRVDSTHVNVSLVLSSVSSNFAGTSFNVVVSDLTTNALALVVTGASQTTGAANDVKLYSGYASFVK